MYTAPTPVSYTHLDVYKRQEHDEADLEIGDFVVVLIVGVGIVLLIAAGDEGEDHDETQEPVSYTHLCMICLGGKIPNGLLIVIMIVASVAAGALWGFLPGIFKAKWNTNCLLYTSRCV